MPLAKIILTVPADTASSDLAMRLWITLGVNSCTARNRSPCTPSPTITLTLRCRAIVARMRSVCITGRSIAYCGKGVANSLNFATKGRPSSTRRPSAIDSKPQVESSKIIARSVIGKLIKLALSGHSLRNESPMKSSASVVARSSDQTNQLSSSVTAATSSTDCKHSA